MTETEAAGSLGADVADVADGADRALADPDRQGRPRIAFLTYSTAEFDSRTARMARSAVDAGYDVVVHARWEPGLPLQSDGPGFRIDRVPVVPALAIPGLRGRGRRQLEAIRRRAAAGTGDVAEGSVGDGGRRTDAASPRPSRPAPADRVPGQLRGTWITAPLRQARVAQRVLQRWQRRIVFYPIRPIAWAVALESTVGPADIWHGMWATSLPALDRLKRRHGGRTLYDSRDVFIHARGMDTMSSPWKWLLGGLERRWARRCDAILTVNDAYAGLLERRFGVPRPPVVRNTPARYVPPSPPPDRLRERLGLPKTTRIVLYQGGLMSDRGIEQGMDAILSVPDATLVLMGYGSQADAIRHLAASSKYADRVRFVEPVAPAELLDWTASSDVMLMAIQPSSLNHRYTTPNKLWEAIAAGVPVVASDLPGMASIVRETGCGVLVDPTDPADIARGINAILDLAPAERASLRDRCRTAGETYAWEHEVAVLLALYGRLAPPPKGPVLPYAIS